MLTWRSWRALVPRSRPVRLLLALAFIAVVLWFLYRYAHDIDWSKVWQALEDIPDSAVLAAMGATVAGYLAYAGMDLLGRRYTGHRLPNPKVAGIAMLSYALNLNLGVLLGGLGARLRLYCRLGGDEILATRVAIFSSLSNWIGFCWLGGALFLSGQVPLPPAVASAGVALQASGAALLLMAAAYTAACWRYAGRTWTIHKLRIVLPSVRMAVAQGVVAVASWAAMGLVMLLLFQGRVSYVAVLGVLLYSGVAAIITRMPGGLGTTEALFVSAFSGQLPAAETLGAVLAYRAVYFIMPLMLSLLAFAGFEARLSWRRHRAVRH